MGNFLPVSHPNFHIRPSSLLSSKHLKTIPFLSVTQYRTITLRLRSTLTLFFTTTLHCSATSIYRPSFPCLSKVLRLNCREIFTTTVSRLKSSRENTRTVRRWCRGNPLNSHGNSNNSSSNNAKEIDIRNTSETLPWPNWNSLSLARWSGLKRIVRVTGERLSSAHAATLSITMTVLVPKVHSVQSVQHLPVYWPASTVAIVIIIYVYNFYNNYILTKQWVCIILLYMYIYIALEGKSVRAHSSNDYVFCVFLFFHLLCFFMVSCPVSVLMMCNVSCICAVNTRKKKRESEWEWVRERETSLNVYTRTRVAWVRWFRVKVCVLV